MQAILSFVHFLRMILLWLCFALVIPLRSLAADAPYENYEERQKKYQNIFDLEQGQFIQVPWRYDKDDGRHGSS